MRNASSVYSGLAKPMIDFKRENRSPRFVLRDKAAAAHEALFGFYKSFGGGTKVSTDSDGDGVVDENDKCPSEKEDADGFEDGDGCPDKDNDNDGIPDGKDKCPNEAGEENSNGCPVSGTS